MPLAQSGGSNVGSSQIIDDEIIDADINSAAGIDRTKLNANVFSKTSGVVTYGLGTDTGTQNIAHGLGRIPTKVKLSAVADSYGTVIRLSFGTYDAAGQRSIFPTDNNIPGSSNTNAIYIVYRTGVSTQVGTITVDDTNIIISWVKTGTPSGNAHILWEAE